MDLRGGLGRAGIARRRLRQCGSMDAACRGGTRRSRWVRSVAAGADGVGTERWAGTKPPSFADRTTLETERPGETSPGHARAAGTRSTCERSTTSQAHSATPHSAARRPQDGLFSAHDPYTSPLSSAASLRVMVRTPCIAPAAPSLPVTLPARARHSSSYRLLLLLPRREWTTTRLQLDRV